MSEIVDRLWKRFVMPSDLRDFWWLRNYHEKLVEVGSRWQGGMIDQVLEIGVRAGYSSLIWAALWDCRILAIDAGVDPDSAAQLDWSVMANDPSRFTLLRVDSSGISRISGDFDFAYIDGDHSLAGCSHDLDLCYGAGIPWVLVDDTLSGGPRQAVDLMVAKGMYVEERIPYSFGDGRLNQMSLLRKN